MKNSTGKWLLVTFLIGMSVLCFALYDQYFISETPPAPNEPAKAEPIIDDVEPVDAEPQKAYNQFPRKATIYQNMATQNVGGTGKETLFEMYEIGGKYYLFFDSDSNSYDVKSTNRTCCCCVAIIDENLTLLAVENLATGEHLTAVKPTGSGFIVTTVSDQYSKIYHIGSDGKAISELYTEKAASVKLFSAGTETLCFFAQDGRVSAKVFSKDFDLLRSQSVAYLGVNKIFNVFPSADGYTVIASGADNFKILHYDRNNGFLGEEHFVNSVLRQFEPIAIDGEQCYFYVANTDDCVKISILDKHFSQTETTTINKPDHCFVAPLAQGFLVVSTVGTESKWMLYCEHLDFVLNCGQSKKANELCYFITASDGKTELCFTSDDSLVFADFYGGELEIKAEFSGATNGVWANGVYAFCCAAKDGFFKQSFGDFDVYLLRPAT